MHNNYHKFIYISFFPFFEKLLPTCVFPEVANLRHALEKRRRAIIHFAAKKKNEGRKKFQCSFAGTSRPSSKFFLSAHSKTLKEAITIRRAKRKKVKKKCGHKQGLLTSNSRKHFLKKPSLFNWSEKIHAEKQFKSLYNLPKYIFTGVFPFSSSSFPVQLHGWIPAQIFLLSTCLWA